MSLRIHDTMEGQKRPFEPLTPGKVGMYVCGVTPYDRCHLGHARCYVAYDLVYRYLKLAGYEVMYVRNFTDVDDKIIKRANERGIEAVALAAENIQHFYDDMDALGIARPNHEPKVSETIEEIIALIQDLEAKGLAYAVNGDVYYAISGFEGYGKLSKRPLDELRAGARVEVNEAKRDPMDFALWKAAKPGEPSWQSPWGEGRPGWHIECSAMSRSRLGAQFDIHGGGRDLIFPHHENEIAQSEGASGHTYVNYWMHNGFITIDKEKMSKSLGNVFNVADILKRYEPQVLRFFMISGTHYRNPINFSDTMLDEAAAKVAYFYETLRKVELFLEEEDEAPNGPLPTLEQIEGLERRFREAMDDDFNVVRALDPIHEAFKTLNELVNVRKKKKRAAAREAARQLLAEIRRLDEVLNLFGAVPELYLERHREKAAARKGLDLAWIGVQISERLAARTARDWAAADAIRDALLDKGVVLMDHPHGTDWSIADVDGVAEADA
ncbi:cysteine--tRNA ligase [Myxococcota bacterium]|nr:cysteine--tRNA ligase [Myxococcota bacterium]